MKKFFAGLRGSCVALGAALFLCSGVAWGAPPVRIMPVGDSITCGSSLAGGYRLPLWGLLTNLGYNVDYVGTNGAACFSASLPDSNHQGHSGWRINQIDVQLLQNFGAIEDPDVLLLMIGTNDFGGNDDLPNATNRLDRLVGKIVTNRPHCKVLVASLTPRGPAGLEANIQTNFNNSVPVIVAKYAAEGGQVYFVDLHAGVSITNMVEAAPNQLHPNAAGYLQMATNWLPAITNVISPFGTTNAPMMVRVSAVTGFTNVTVTFSKPVSEATATNLANYFTDNGAGIVGATLDTGSQRKVTLDLTGVVPDSTYNLVVQGIQDQTPAATEMVAALTNFTTVLLTNALPNSSTNGAGQRGVFNNVAEAGDYRLVYSLNIPNAPNFSAGITYDRDLRAFASNFTRVAYYLELQPVNGVLNYMWVSFDAMTTNVNQIGVPNTPSGATFQQFVTNMNVNSSAFGIVNGTNMGSGNMEFWPGNYSQANAIGIPNASPSTFDWGDTLSAGTGHGSMQVHSHGNSQVLFAFNRWNAGSGADLGIGNGLTNADWTFSANSAGYTVKLLQVYALLASNVPPVLAGANAPGFTNVVLGFSVPLADDATNTANYALSSGITVLDAALDPLTKQTVTLTTSMLPGGTHTAVVNNVHDRSSSNSLVIATNSLATFSGPALNGVFNNVAGATNYSLVYSLSIPTGAAYNANGVAYDVAVPQYIGEFTRVAYYLELQTATGLPNYIWVEMDPFTTNANRLGVPASSSSPIFQQLVTNMTVQSSVAGIVQGAGINTGNIEFWPWDYQAGNSNNVPGASNSAYDWGDRVMSNSGGHGSMQIHNNGASQTLFAFNNWGNASGGTTALGIGNRPGTADVDWTFAANSGSYTGRTLQVFALQVSNSAPALAGASALNSNSVVLTFSEMLDASSVDVTNFTIAGVTIVSATLDPVNFARVTLVTTPLAVFTTYTTLVSNVRDRSPLALEIAPASSVTFRTAPAPGVFVNVPEAADYSLVQSLDLPAAASYPHAAVYDTDLRAFVTNFTRVAYYLELQQAGATNFVWTSFDALTNNINAISIPTLASGATFQQPVTNLNIVCSVTSVVSGTGLSSGNIEFWPSSYGQNNTQNVANAKSNFYDWGDVRSGGNYGSMQIHNNQADLGISTGQVVWAFNRWGGTSLSANDLGIGNRVGSSDVDWTGAQNAGSYTVRRLQVYVLSTTNLPPVVVAAAGLPGLSNVVISFSDPLADTATNLANFSISGLTVLGASLDVATKTKITLTTSPQVAGQTYTVTMNGITDRSTAALPLAPATTASFMAAPPRGALANVPEAAAYTLACSLNLPNSGNFNIGSGVVYSVDNRAVLGPFTRIAYYVELVTSGGAPNFVWASMDAFTSDANKIGVPNTASGAFFQQPVTNLNVVSSAFGIQTGTAMSGGNIEFWTNVSLAANSASVPNASGTSLDFGDQPAAGVYGSMQIHNSAANQTLFALNNWGTANGNYDLGIGNNFSTTNTDWTGMFNAGLYTAKVLQVYVLQTGDTTPPSVLSAIMSPDRRSIVLTFSELLADGAASLANFSIDNGATLSAATLATNLRQITLACSTLTPGTTYTLTLSGVRDRSPNANVIPPGTTVVVAAPAAPAHIVANVPEASEFIPVYQVNIPLLTPSWNVSGTTYAVNNSAAVGAYDRIAYYMELVTAEGATNWVYVSLDPFTSDATKIGVPDMMAGVRFQQLATNLNVFSSASNLTTGTGLPGNIEFWPFNYVAANAIAIPNASASTLDFGDTVSLTFGTDGYGSMQIHNYAVSNVIFALNRWGGGQGTNAVEVGIGSSPSGNPDWTSVPVPQQNWRSRTLHVLVRPVNDTTGPLVTSVFPGYGGTNLAIRFNEPLDETSVAVTNFALDGGLTVSTATLAPNLRDILIGTSPQTPGASYIVTMSNVRDLSTNANLITPATVANFTALSAIQNLATVTEATNYTLVHRLALPTTVPNYNANGITYTNDQRAFLGTAASFNRIAYLMELATNNGPTNWVWVSAENWTPFIQRVGVPVLGNGAGFQGRITNMNVASSVASISITNASATGNIEFWPLNYGANTNNLVPTGSTTNYDWNDTYSTAGQYGSMQIHNHGVIVPGFTGQVLFAFNKWGGGQSGNASMGLGSQPPPFTSAIQPDWTFADNAAAFTTKNLYTFIQPTNAPAVAPALATNPLVFVMNPTSRTNLLNTTNAIGALAVGSAPTYQWRRNGTPIPGQTNSWIAFNDLQLADGGIYDITASNALGVVTSAPAVLVVNRLPIAGPDTFGALRNTPIDKPGTYTIQQDIDLDSDPLTITSLGPTTLNAGTAIIAGPTLTYTPPTDFTGSDTFLYVITDGRGGYATGLVTVIVMTNHTPEITGSGTATTNGIRFTGTGVSNGLYTIERTANLLNGVWTFHTNVPADTNGLFLIQDNTLPRPTNRYYRVIIP